MLFTNSEKITMSLINTLKGTGVAIVTPFASDNSIDFLALEKIVNSIIEGGVNYIVSLGTTGETPTLSKSEKSEIVAFTSKIINKRVPLVIGIGGNATDILCEEIQNFDCKDAVAILSAAPYYNKPSQEGIIQHYTAVADVSKLPIIMYNVPGRTGRNMEVSTISKLSSHKNIAGIKEAAGSVPQTLQILKNTADDFLVVSGDDDLAVSQIASGIHGVISVAANCFPSQFSTMVNAALSGNFESANKINSSLLEAYDLLFAENNPAGVKYFLYKMNMLENNLRLPLVALSQGVQKKIDHYLSNTNG